jgi:hypothetical protein
MRRLSQRTDERHLNGRGDATVRSGNLTGDNLVSSSDLSLSGSGGWKAGRGGPRG